MVPVMSGKGRSASSAISDDSSIADGVHGEKVPWQKVADFIAEKGSYRFGNATCRKKWDELKTLQKA